MQPKRTKLIFFLPFAFVAVAAATVVSAVATDGLVQRGRYLTVIGGCNDCHTPGYLEKSGVVPEDVLLSGNSLGFQGPWGTTYPSNLRLGAASMSESQWLAHARTARRPPMPWFNVRAMSDADLRAIYAFLRSLGAGGEPAPAYVPPGEHVATPYIEFVPKNLPAPRRAAG